MASCVVADAVESRRYAQNVRLSDWRIVGLEAEK
jgi:hypothetical protein